MKILASYTDPTTQLIYNIVDKLQPGDPIYYGHVYFTVQDSASNGAFFGQVRVCAGVPCTICVFKGQNCSNFDDIVYTSSRFNEVFPDFHQMYPELLI